MLKWQYHSALSEINVNHNRNVGVAHVEMRPWDLFHSETLAEVIILKLTPMGVPSNMEGFPQIVKL